jgi:hypothetical protein
MSQPLGNPSLTKLVERAQKGDKEAFGTLAHYYQLGLGA